MRWDTGIDLGTANVRMADSGSGLVLDEPALVALRDDDSAAYVGENAWRLLGREPEGLKVAGPLRDGVPESTLHTQRMFQWLMRGAMPSAAAAGRCWSAARHLPAPHTARR